ncbi:MAG: hypothetical protein JNJ49_06175 [Bdellovibrionaceae bacterium]|nr:hypothetical protein [Pseudobdellovibrionaceae bacterium]
MNPPFGFFKFVAVVALMFYVAGRAIVPGFLRDVNPMIVGVLVYVWYRWARTKAWWPRPMQGRDDTPKQVQVPHGVLLEKLKKKARVSQKRATGRPTLPQFDVSEESSDVAFAESAMTAPASKERAKRVRAKTVRKKVTRARRAKMDRDC